MSQPTDVAYIDTNIVIWLGSGNQKKFPKKAANAIDKAHSLLISPIVLLELEYLHEVGRLKVGATELHSYLSLQINLQVCQLQMPMVVQAAIAIGWTRDPFDRMITAQAAANSMARLITADEIIREHYKAAVWE